MELAAIASLLQLSAQPAFAVSDGTVLALNPAAAELGLRCGMETAAFLRPSPLPDRQPAEVINGTVFGLPCRIRAAAEADITVVFLEPNKSESPQASAIYHTLARTAGAMRQTLQSLLSSVELLSEYLDLNQEAQASHAAFALRSVYQLVRMADNLNVHALLQQGSYPLQKTPQSVLSLFETLCERAQQLLRYDRIELDYQLPEKDLAAWMDVGLIRLAFWNLLANAAAHAADRRLFVRLLRDGDSGVIITVTNRLEDALPEQQLFERCNSDPSELSSREGLGLGLGLALQVARLHGGNLLLSARQKGCFTALLRLCLEPAVAQTMNSPILLPQRDLNDGLVGLSDILPVSAFDPRGLL